MNHGNLLKSLYLFKGLNPDQIEQIAAVSFSETYASGEEIFSQGDQASAIYFIKLGSVRIEQQTRTGNPIEVSNLGSGSHFGEMSFVDRQPRSASARTTERTELVIVPYEKLSLLLEKDLELAVMFYRELAHFLCGRLRLTTTDLSFAREKNLSHF